MPAFRDGDALDPSRPIVSESGIHGLHTMVRRGDVKVNYYEDGKTVHSKVTYEHGRKNGPAIWYFKDGNVYEHVTFYQNRRHGLTRRYYQTGELMEEVTYETGEELPGKKTYDKSGKLISR